MPSFFNGRNIGRSMRRRQAAGLERFTAAGVGHERAPALRMLRSLDLPALTIDGKALRVCLSRFQIADALDMHPTAIWRWTQHPEFPQPVDPSLADCPQTGSGRRCQYWDMDAVGAWVYRYAPNRRSAVHAFAWWVAELAAGTWTAQDGYRVLTRLDVARDLYRRKCIRWEAAGLDPYGENPPAELDVVRALEEGSK